MDQLSAQWNRTRHGAHAIRGFHFQDAIATHIAVRGWAGNLPVQAVVPEGHEDISILLTDGWLHVQAKSRRSHRGSFELGEVAKFMVEAWNAHEERVAVQPGARVALVLERDVQGVPTSGWGKAIVEVPALSTALRPQLESRLGRSERVDELLAATSLVVIVEPREVDLETISDRIALPRESCNVHYQSLLSDIGSLADENGERATSDPAQLVMADVQALFDHSTELLDIDALEEAIRNGICEVVNFVTPIPNPHFYEGIDVIPGHVVAGLTIERPELEQQILDGLTRSGVVLVVGPSGAGKSAAAWTSAFASRHRIRWYRIKRLQEGDVPVVMRLTRAVRPSVNAPVGLVVDDLGRTDRDGWDSLVAESAHYPGVVMLGVVREEDLALLSSASLCHQVRPKLDESMAYRLWRELSTTGATGWGDWREPYEQATGLLLEYGYLLTTGERLASTIAGQINRRVLERRSLELRILRLVAVADCWEATVPTSALRRLLGTEERDEDLQLALARLLEEHLVRETAPGTFGGLHWVRSRHIVHESHRFGVPTLSETVCEVVSKLSDISLQPFVTGVLTEHVVPDGDLLDCMADRLRSHPSPELLIAGLQALRLVSFFRLASTWPAILEEVQVPRSKQHIATQLALVGTTTTEFLLPSIRAAIERMSMALADDLRGQLINRLSDSEIQQALLPISDIRTGTQLLAALSGLKIPRLMENLNGLDALVLEPPVAQLAPFLAAAHGVDVELAAYLANAAGGPEKLLQRLEQEEPWICNLHITEDESGSVIAMGEVRNVSPHSQPDPHGAVVALCRQLLSCVPSAEIVACRAIDASGALAGYGDFHLADTRIPRRNLPSDAEVAWNRARMRLAAGLLAARTQTERLVMERDLLTRLVSALPDAADYWCRGQRLPLSLAQELSGIESEAERLPPPPAASPNNLDPLDEDEGGSIDPVDILVPGIVRAIARLFDSDSHPAALAAYVHDTLLPKAVELLDPGRWRLLSASPIEAIHEIERDLVDLQAVISECHAGGQDIRDRITMLARRGRSSRNLGRCADYARERASDRLGGRIEWLVKDLDARGITVQIFRRQPHQHNKHKGLVWPPDEVAIAVQLASVFEWEWAVQKVVAACGAAFDGVFDVTRRIVAMPLRGDCVVGSLAGRVQSGKLYPTSDALAGWGVDLPLLFLEENAAAPYSQVLEALVEISAILANGKATQMHQAEQMAIEAAVDRLSHASTSLTLLATKDETGVIQEALNFIRKQSDQVQVQLNSPKPGTPSTPLVALAFLAVGHGEVNDTVNTAGLIKLSLVEWDIEPQCVYERLDLAVQRVSAN